MKDFLETYKAGSVLPKVETLKEYLSITKLTPNEVVGLASLIRDSEVDTAIDLFKSACHLSANLLEIHSLIKTDMDRFIPRMLELAFKTT